MRSPQSVKALEQLGRVRLSDSFFMRDLLLIRLLGEYYDKTGNWQALAWWIHDNVSREFLRSIKT